ncbi:unnamed protein product [Cuscuta epithymum]|uniref:Uncharacterized protein n=1 Tax=Cuscuta epithymum TaxID=186058 RepID=A0AAV0FNM1_9ASTE|nr:unnamed protein product [Cuscuta epithymum]
MTYNYEYFLASVVQQQAAFSWLLATIAFLFIINQRQPRKRKTPPGPKPWPITGNLNLLGSIPHQSLDSLSQKYGELMLLNLGSTPVLVASSPKTAKLVLKTHDAVFASRHTPALGARLFEGGALFWSPYGPWLRQGRRILSAELGVTRKIDSLEYVRVEERISLVSRLYEEAAASKPVLLRDHLSKLTGSISARLLSDHKKSCKTGDGRELRTTPIDMKRLNELVEEFFRLGGLVSNLGDWVPWLRPFDLQGCEKRVKGFSEEYEQFLDPVIEEHRALMKAAGKDFVPNGLIDVFLQRADDPNVEESEVALTRHRIMGLIHDVVSGGTDTSTGSLEWAFQEMARKPNVMEKAKEELDRVIGRERWVEEKDIAHLPYIESIIKETFRLHPVGTLLPRYSMEDCNLDGYEVTKGTISLVNVWSIGRNPEYWERAEQFLPERFLGSDIDVKGNDFSILPFGSGRRMCPGYNLGLKVVQATLANLLHGFNWKLSGGMKPEDVSMEEVYGLTTHPKFQLSYLIEPRLLTHLY